MLFDNHLKPRASFDIDKLSLEECIAGLCTDKKAKRKIERALSKEPGYDEKSSLAALLGEEALCLVVARTPRDDIVARYGKYSDAITAFSSKIAEPINSPVTYAEWKREELRQESIVVECRKKRWLQQAYGEALDCKMSQLAKETINAQQSETPDNPFGEK